MTMTGFIVKPSLGEYQAKMSMGGRHQRQRVKSRMGFKGASDC
jgi:hypothetical protein